jgi:hypothetical protein
MVQERHKEKAWKKKKRLPGSRPWSGTPHGCVCPAGVFCKQQLQNGARRQYFIAKVLRIGQRARLSGEPQEELRWQA